jgi:hypothetical protein
MARPDLLHLMPLTVLCQQCHVYGVCVTYKTGSGLDDWIFCTLYIHTTGDYS